jgi:DNA-binding CsgD family transcriptional regulator
MSKSARLRLGDLRALYELAGECRDLGDDSQRWRVHFAGRLCRLIDADICLGGDVTGLPAGPPRILGLTEWGWENGHDRSGWQKSCELFQSIPDFSYSPALREYLRHAATEDGVCRSRRDVMADPTWYRSWVCEHVNRASGMDHNLWCFRSLPLCPDGHMGLSPCRVVGRADFTARQKAIAQEAVAAFAPLVGGPLSPYHEPSPAELAPRVRQVLRCILEGDGDKQIAARLGISTHTVNQYTKTIYQHFGVRCRPELMARWVRRGWGGGFAWADG